LFYAVILSASFEREEPVMSMSKEPAVVCFAPLFVFRCHPERSLARTLRQTQSKSLS
jgi:hypothetical protein